MLLVGLTGNIASGKSTVARLLAGHGATVVDADVLARRAVEPGTPALERITERWGSQVLAPDGVLDRGVLRERVFGSAEDLEALNAIVHPEVARMAQEEIEAARGRGDRVVVYDVPLLFERHLAGEFDRILLVDAPRELRLERLVRDRGLSTLEATNMIAAQMPAELKRARSDYVVDNVGSREALAGRVAEVWRALEREADERAEHPSTVS